MWDVLALKFYAFTWARLAPPDLYVVWHCNYLAILLHFPTLKSVNKAAFFLHNELQPVCRNDL